MKKPILAALAAITLTLAAASTSTPLLAQAASGQPRAHAAGRMRNMANALGLTDAQKAQIKPILKNAFQQAQAIKTNTSLTLVAKKAKLKALNQSVKAQIAAILTPEQQAKLAAMKQHHA